MGIGINSGTAVVGNIGSADKMKYGCMGETVNLAEDKRYSRLIKRLSRKMRRYVDTGRSTPGKRQDVPPSERNWEFTDRF